MPRRTQNKFPPFLGREIFHAPSADEIVAARRIVAEAYNITEHDLMVRGRGLYAEARQVLASLLSGNDASIGAALGISRTTVYHARIQVKNFCLYPMFRVRFEELKAQLEEKNIVQIPHAAPKFIKINP